MRITLRVSLEQGEKNEEIMSGSIAVKPKPALLPKELYHTLLAAAAAKLLAVKANETLEQLVHSLNNSLKLNNGEVMEEIARHINDIGAAISEMYYHNTDMAEKLDERG
jgi:hypothetical protein